MRRVLDDRGSTSATFSPPLHCPSINPVTASPLPVSRVRSSSATWTTRNQRYPIADLRGLHTGPLNPFFGGADNVRATLVSSARTETGSLAACQETAGRGARACCAARGPRPPFHLLPGNGHTLRRRGARTCDCHPVTAGVRQGPVVPPGIHLRLRGGGVDSRCGSGPGPDPAVLVTLRTGVRVGSPRGSGEGELAHLLAALSMCRRPHIPTAT